jgi:hypothetical protein
MPPKVKHTKPALKNTPKGRPAKAPHGRGVTSHKRQIHDDSESSESSDESTKRPQKRQRQKGKGKRPVPIPVESVEERSGEESDGPELLNVDTLEPENDAGHEHVWVCSLHIRPHVLIDGPQQASDLEEKHQAKIGGELATKGETTKDLDLMFSKRVKVNFRKSGKETLVKGRWCITCK